MKMTFGRALVVSILLVGLFCLCAQFGWKVGPGLLVALAPELVLLLVVALIGRAKAAVLLQKVRAFFSWLRGLCR